MLAAIASLFRRRPMATRYAVLAVVDAPVYRFVLVDREGFRWVVECDRRVVARIARELNRKRKAVAS